MKYIYSPHRAKYLKTKIHKCPFCDIENNENIIYKAKYNFIIMNLYPYTPGHFMVMPYKHISDLNDLDEATWLELSILVKHGVNILKTHFDASGVNIGMNLGSAAGAGVPDHMHYHLVPRWPGDTNFITTIGHTRIIGQDLNELKDRLKYYFSLI